MTPRFDCVVKPDSLSNQNSHHYLYGGVFGSKYPAGHLLGQLGATGKREKSDVVLDAEKVASFFSPIHNQRNKPLFTEISFENRNS